MSDELRARATWLPPWGSCHGGAVTERAVPVRGIDCAETYLPWNAPLHAAAVPARGNRPHHYICKWLDGDKQLPSPQGA